MENEVSFESALQKLKSMFDCPTEDGNPAKGTWCGNCREICDADGTNWCDRNLYLDSVLAVEAAHKREIASLRAKRNKLFEQNEALRTFIGQLGEVLKDACKTLDEHRSMVPDEWNALVDMARTKSLEVCK